MPGERTIRPSNALSSTSLAVLSLHASNGYFPDGDADKIRLLDNPRWQSRIDTDLPALFSTNDPVLVTGKLLREVLASRFVDHDHFVDEHGDPLISTVVKSASYRSTSPGERDVEKDVSPVIIINRARSAIFTTVYDICNADRTREEIYTFAPMTARKLPACLGNFKRLNVLDMSDKSSISKIENVDGLKKLEYLSLSNNDIHDMNGIENVVTLKTLALQNSKVSKIDGLDTLVDLRTLNLNGTRVSKIENLGKLENLKRVHLSNTNVGKIENVEKNKKLEELYLVDTNVSKIENLDTNVNLKVLDVRNTVLTPGDCAGFEDRHRKLSPYFECRATPLLYRRGILDSPRVRHDVFNRAPVERGHDQDPRLASPVDL